ncbi:unnamed protein product [Oreochromis niloticus]|nr:unnamed protein product [Mustela putorius furo]
MNKKKVKIFSYVDGETMDSHEKFLKKLFKRGAKEGKSAGESDAVIVFVPIVSRFETDINSALSNISAKKVIVVALHHTYDPNYTVPHNRNMDDKLVVNCLFYEKKGLLSCPCNKKARKMVCKELKLPGKWAMGLKKDKEKTRSQNNPKESA